MVVGFVFCGGVFFFWRQIFCFGHVIVKESRIGANPNASLPYFSGCCILRINVLCLNKIPLTRLLTFQEITYGELRHIHY